jgi:hypothetical protein
MVKVAASNYPPQADLWSKLALLSHPNVVRTHRTSEVEGHFYEIQEFCSGGTLADLVPLAGSGRPIPPPEWVERALVPSFHAGITYLHEQGIIHRDIKPSNLYLRETNGRKTLVIGDFDISSVLQTGRTSRATERAAGTWIYSAPEALPRLMDANASQRGASIARSSDYYSFGVVIVELLVGTTSLHQAEFPEIADFYLQGGRVEIPSNLSPRLTELLGGLLCRNRQRRWGAEQVTRWLAHQTTEEDRRAISEDRGFQLGRSAAAFNSFERSKPTTLAELSVAINQEPVIALEELMGSDVMLNWIGQLDARVARYIRQDREKWRAHPQVALLCTRLRLDPDAPLSVDGQRWAYSAGEWIQYAQLAVSKGTVAADKLFEQERVLELENWLRLKSNPELEFAERVVQIAAHHGLVTEANARAAAGNRVIPPNPYTSKVASNPLLVLEELSYAFLPQKPYLIASGITAQTPQQIAHLSLGKAEDWGSKPPPFYISAAKRWQEGYLEAYLRQRLVGDSGTTSPLLKQIEKVRGDFAGKPFVAFEVILRLLAPDLPPVGIEFDTIPFQNVLEVPYGQEASVAIDYWAQGAGMPYAAVQLQSQWEALSLETNEISHRQGQIKLHLHPGGDIPVGRQYHATLNLKSQTTKLLGEQKSLSYRVNYPASVTLKRVALGALMGAAILGGARLAVMSVVPRALRYEHLSLLSGSTWMVILPILGAAFYGAFRLWLWALVKHAR